MFTGVQITSFLSIIIITGFAIYVYLEIKSIQKEKNPKKTDKVNFADCPDFFETIVKNGKKYCKNTYKLGNANNTKFNDTISFEDEIFNDNKKGNYMKCKWAKSTNNQWSGIERLC